MNSHPQEFTLYLFGYRTSMYIVYTTLNQKSNKMKFLTSVTFVCYTENIKITLLL